MTTKELTYRQAFIKGRYVNVPDADKMVLIKRCTFGGYELKVPGDTTSRGSIYSTLRYVEKCARDASRRLGLPIVKDWEIVQPREIPALPWFILIDKDTIDGHRVVIYGAQAREIKERHLREPFFVTGMSPEKIDIARAIVAAMNATRKVEAVYPTPAEQIESAGS